MARYMAVFMAPVDPETPRPSPERMQAGMAAWGAWMRDHASRIVDAGGPLGPTTRVSTAGAAPARNRMAGYVIVEAEGPEAAARLFENHPSFAIFPGEGVDVMPVQAIPVSPDDLGEPPRA